MRKNDQHQLLIVAKVDLGMMNYEEGMWLDAHAVVTGADVLARLRAAATLQDDDDHDPRAQIYLVKAWAQDAVTGEFIGIEEWIGLCQEQHDRIYDEIADCEIPPSQRRAL